MGEKAARAIALTAEAVRLKEQAELAKEAAFADSDRARWGAAASAAKENAATRAAHEAKRHEAAAKKEAEGAMEEADAAKADAAASKADAAAAALEASLARTDAAAAVHAASSASATLHDDTRFYLIETDGGCAREFSADEGYRIETFRRAGAGAAALELDVDGERYHFFRSASGEVIASVDGGDGGGGGGAAAAGAVAASTTDFVVLRSAPLVSTCPALMRTRRFLKSCPDASVDSSLFRFTAGGRAQCFCDDCIASAARPPPYFNSGPTGCTLRCTTPIGWTMIEVHSPQADENRACTEVRHSFELSLIAPPLLTPMFLFHILRAQWHAAYHGTQVESLLPILKTGGLGKPGDTVLGGHKLTVVPGHITKNHRRQNDHLGRLEDFDKVQIFLSPAIEYVLVGVHGS